MTYVTAINSCLWYIYILYKYSSLQVSKMIIEINWGVQKLQRFYYSRSMQIIMKHGGGHINFETDL